MPATRAIQSMPLYVNVDRIYHELAELGISDDDKLAPEQLFPFDHYHYHGTGAVREAAVLLGFNAASHVLEGGSGLGAPAVSVACTFFVGQ